MPLTFSRRLANLAGIALPIVETARRCNQLGDVAVWPCGLDLASQETLNRYSGTVIAMAITSQAPRAQFPLTCQIQSLRMPKPSWVKISQVRTLAIERLRKRIGSLSPDEIASLVEGLNARVA